MDRGRKIASQAPKVMRGGRSRRHSVFPLTCLLGKAMRRGRPYADVQDTQCRSTRYIRGAYSVACIHPPSLFWRCFFYFASFFVLPPPPLAIDWGNGTASEWHGSSWNGLARPKHLTCHVFSWPLALGCWPLSVPPSGCRVAHVNATNRRRRRACVY